MRAIVRHFARDAVAALPIEGPLVEIGARAAAGQEAIADLRPIFEAVRPYIGSDIQPGRGVDRVDDVHQLAIPDGSVGTVVCFDTLEHIADPLAAVQEMHRVLRPGGVVLLTSVMFFVIHEHPWDYWRFTPEGVARLLTPFETSLVLAHGYDLMPETVFGVGIKGPYALSESQFPTVSRLQQSWAVGRPVDMGPIRFSLPALWRFTVGQTIRALRQRLRA